MKALSKDPASISIDVNKLYDLSIDELRNELFYALMALRGACVDYYYPEYRIKAQEEALEVLTKFERI